MNKWGIPIRLEEKVRKRDKFCVYCGVKMKEYPRAKGTPRDKATWEHIDNDGPYCKKKKINKETIANTVRKSLSK